MRFCYQGRQIRRSTDVTDRKVAEQIYYKVRGLMAAGTGVSPRIYCARLVRSRSISSARPSLRNTKRADGPRG